MSDLLLFSIRLLGMVAVLNAAVYFRISKPRNSVSYLALGVCLGVFAYFLVSGSFISIDASYRLSLGIIRVPLLVLAASVPCLLMLLSQHLFTEKRNLPIWAVFLFALQIGLDIISANTIDWNCQTANCLTYPRDRFSFSVAAYHTLPTLIKLSFCLFAFIWAVKDWRFDLVQARRYGRQLFIAILAVLGGGVVAAEDFTLAISGIVQYFPLVSTIDTVLLALFFMVMTFLLMRYRGRELVEDLIAPEPPLSETGIASPAPINQEDKDVAALQVLLRDGVYRQTGLNVSRLAEALSIPQYRLRQLIHAQFGFRHFNTFINHFRLLEACQQLRDPKYQDTPILDIALAVGFGSITSFNDAFKKNVGLSPSAYRVQSRASP